MLIATEDGIPNFDKIASACSFVSGSILAYTFDVFDIK
jgi:hypothetical protein